MKRLKLRPICAIATAVGILAFCSPIVQADDRPLPEPSSKSVAPEAPERVTREHAHALLREQAERLNSLGHKEGARAVAEKAEQLARKLEAAKRGQMSSPERLTRDRAEARLREIHEQIERLREEGNQEEAQELAEEAEKLVRAVEAAERRQNQGPNPVTLEQAHLRELQAEAQRLQAQGRQQEARGVAEKAARLALKIQAAQRGRPHGENHENLAPEQRVQLLQESVQHLQQSAAKLQAAGIKDAAEHIQRIAEQLAKQARESAIQLQERGND